MQAVDVASLFVPKGSDMISARGRECPNVLYQSCVEPLVDPSMTIVVVLGSGTQNLLVEPCKIWMLELSWAQIELMEKSLFKV
jgi:hypothetical protein